MILLSALLASLTGMVAGERPVERAQVELSAAAAFVQQGTAVARAATRPAQVMPSRAVADSQPGFLTFPAHVQGSPTLLDLKQGWRE